MPQATPTKSDGNATSFSFPAVHRKKVTAAFDGGRITSDGGVLLLAQAERAMGIADKPLDLAFIVALAGAAELVLKQIMALQG